MQSTIQEFTTIPQIARGANVSVGTADKRLKRAGLSPDAIVVSGNQTLTLFSLPRLNSLVSIASGETTPPQIEAQ